VPLADGLKFLLKEEVIPDQVNKVLFLIAPTVSLFTTMLDHAGPLAPGRDLTDPTSLAGLARELAANDPQERNHNRRGLRSARNVELLVPDPR
jgi:hypothetical protein